MKCLLMMLQGMGVATAERVVKAEEWGRWTNICRPNKSENLSNWMTLRVNLLIRRHLRLQKIYTMINTRCPSVTNSQSPVTRWLKKVSCLRFHPKEVKTSQVTNSLRLTKRTKLTMDIACNMELVETVPYVLKKKGLAKPMDVEHLPIHEVSINDSPEPLNVADYFQFCFFNRAGLS